jgi:glycerophosphoryl diester phosphodiesterase
MRSSPLAWENSELTDIRIALSMTISFRLSDNGFVHVCAHRGYSLHYPENTILAFDMARKAGATTCEIDIGLTRDGEAVTLHDATLNRTTNGFGFLDDHDLADVRALDAAAQAPAGFRNVTVPTFKEVVEWAIGKGMGLEVELKERRNREALMKRVIEVLTETGGFGHVIVISFDHVDLRRIKELDARIRTEPITHARHADIVGVLRSCGADAVSIELGMFTPEDAHALHDAGFCQRVHLPRPAHLAAYWAAGRDPRVEIGRWLERGLIDSISGDDVPFLRSLVDAHGPERKHAPQKHVPAAAG